MCYHFDQLYKLDREIPSESALTEWALEVCKVSRQTNISLWSFRLTSEECKRLRDMLLSLFARMPDTKAFHLYRRNVLARAASAESYLFGGMPVAPIDSPEEEVELSVAVRELKEKQEKMLRENPPVCVPDVVQG